MNDWTLWLGWIANTILLFGVIFLGKKWRTAFLFTFVGEVGWTVVAIAIGRTDMTALCVVFAILALRNWRLWRNVPEETDIRKYSSDGEVERHLEPDPEGPDIHTYFIRCINHWGNARIDVVGAVLKVGQKVRITIEEIE